MALHTELPIYKVAYDLLSAATDFVQNMPRPVKTAVGGRLSGLCIEAVLLILRANCANDKLPHLSALLERVAELNLLLRLCCDKRFISRKQYAAAIQLTASIGRQANGWRKHATSPVS